MISTLADTSIVMIPFVGSFIAFKNVVAANIKNLIDERWSMISNLWMIGVRS